MLEKLLSMFTAYKLMDFTELNDTIGYYLPYQLVKIVEQAHRHESFSTDPHISVSGEMRRKLMYPLTQDQVLLIAGTTYPVTENDFRYELLEHSYKKNSLYATVMVNIDYHDTVKGVELHHHDVPVYIKCTGRPGHGWEVTQVETKKIL